MGVGRPEDFVAPLNRFPVHNHRVTKPSDALFATISTRPLVVLLRPPVRRCRPLGCKLVNSGTVTYHATIVISDLSEKASRDPFRPGATPPRGSRDSDAFSVLLR